MRCSACGDWIKNGKKIKKSNCAGVFWAHFL